MAEALADKELEQYRNLLETPTEFKDGFGWTAVIGVLFCGLVMMPGSIYLGLMTGGGIGAAAQWVTVILFTDIMRRAMKSLNKQQIVVLLQAAGAMVGGGAISQLVLRAYMVRSDPVRDAGMRDAFPHWWVPSPESPAITGRNLLHSDWLIPIAVVVGMSLIGFVNKYTLGYFFFRLTSDIEKLPFPMAPIQAQGALALAEGEDGVTDTPVTEVPVSEDFIARKPGKKKKSDRWRLFSLGIVVGIAFGFVQVGIPAISGLFLDKPIFLIPQPFLDTTTLTESFLPATPTGVVIDLGIILIGMVLPFWAVIGTFVAIMMTLILNPLLHHLGILSRWQPGMDTVNTSFANSVDFWLSFGIGTGLGIAAVSVFQTIRDVSKRLTDIRRQKQSIRAEEAGGSIWTPPRAGRGDWSIGLSLGGYVVSSLVTISLCYSLLPKNLTLLTFLVVFAFVYNPLISYVNARLKGISGQEVNIPYIREASFILSGAKGIEVWLAPIPIESYGGYAESFRVIELTGLNFRSLIKLDLLVIPVSLVLSFVFWAFIWSSESIPSAAFPWAQVNWELQAKQNALLWSSTHLAIGQTQSNIMDSQFMQAIHPLTIGAGFTGTVLLFVFLSIFGLPVMLVYGIIRGFGGLPHTLALELIGALCGRFYFQKKFGSDNFLRMVPTVLAGYFTGVGLISMATIAIKLIKSAISSAPF